MGIHRVQGLGFPKSTGGHSVVEMQSGCSQDNRARDKTWLVVKIVAGV